MSGWNHREWSSEELERLRGVYPTSSWPVLEETFSRSESSIRSKASRLGIERREVDLSEIMRIREERAKQGLLVDV